MDGLSDSTDSANRFSNFAVRRFIPCQNQPRSIALETSRFNPGPKAKTSTGSEPQPIRRPGGSTVGRRACKSRSGRHNTGVNDDEIIFTVREDEVEGGCVARALGYSIFTEADTLEQLRVNVKEATACYFDEAMPAPRIIRLRFARDEVFAR